MQHQWLTLDKVSDISKQIILIKTDLEQDHIKLLLEKPWWNKNHSFVNKILTNICQGTHLVSMPDDSIEINKMVNNDLKKIKLIISDDKNTILKLMEKGCCHDNASELLKTNQVKKMHTGFALSKDRLWRYHSWGISRSGKIIETTILRLVYVPITIIKKSGYWKYYYSHSK